MADNVNTKQLIEYLGVALEDETLSKLAVQVKGNCADGGASAAELVRQGPAVAFCPWASSIKGRL